MAAFTSPPSTAGQRGRTTRYEPPVASMHPPSTSSGPPPSASSQHERAVSQKSRAVGNQHFCARPLRLRALPVVSLAPEEAKVRVALWSVIDGVPARLE